MLKKVQLILLSIALLIVSVACGSQSEDGEVGAEIPTIGIGYMFSNHQTPLIVAAAKNEDLKDEGVYLKEVVEKEKYMLMEGEEEIANIDLITANNGGEVMTMMGQGTLDMGLSSITLPMTAVDNGASMKILGPIHADGIGLVMPLDSDIDDLDSFIEHLETREKPIKIGYHSPANAPVIVFRSAMEDMGITSTEDPEDNDADILLVNLKGTANLMPALQSGEVEGWVGPSPFPELAELEEVGKTILDMRDLPPTGDWHNFPCCVISANDSTIEQHPEVVEKMFELLTIASEFSNENREETGAIVSQWMGVDERAAKNTMTIFTTNPDERWRGHAKTTYDSLVGIEGIENDLKGKSFEEVRDMVFNFEFAEKVIGKN